MVQGLGLRTLPAEGPASIPGQEIQSHKLAVRQKKEKEKT